MINIYTVVCYRQGTKNRKNRPIFWRFFGYQLEWREKNPWKNRLKKFRRKIAHFSEKIGKIPTFSRFFGVWRARAEERVWRRFSSRFFGDKLKKPPIYRRFIGVFSALFLAFRSVPGFDPTVQISSVFFE